MTGTSCLFCRVSSARRTSAILLACVMASWTLARSIALTLPTLGKAETKERHRAVKISRRRMVSSKGGEGLGSDRQGLPRRCTLFNEQHCSPHEQSSPTNRQAYSPEKVRNHTNCLEPAFHAGRMLAVMAGFCSAPASLPSNGMQAVPGSSNCGVKQINRCDLALALRASKRTPCPGVRRSCRLANSRSNGMAAIVRLNTARQRCRPRAGIVTTAACVQNPSDLVKGGGGARAHVSYSCLCA